MAMLDHDRPFVVLRSDSGVDLVVLRGDIDHHDGVPRLEKTLAGLVERPGAKILLDFRDATYCCSAAIALILDAHEAVKGAGGVLVCSSVSGAARVPMDILDIPDVIPFFESCGAAIEALEMGAVGAAPAI